MSHVDKLKDLLYSQKRTVSIRDICYSLNVHVSEARRILDDFVAQESKKDDAKLDVIYVVTGSGLDSTEDYKVHKLIYAKSEELDEVKKGFETVTSCKVFSISLKNEENVVNEDKVQKLLLDRDDLLKQQKLTYIVNDDIQLRPDRLERLKLISGIQVNGSNADVKCEVKPETIKKENKTETKKETKSSNKKTTNRRNNNSNKKQSKLSGFGSKIPKNEKTNSSGDSGFSMESTPDPFSEEEEEEKSPERREELEEEEKMEVVESPSSPSPVPSPESVDVESEDEKPKRKLADSDDEAIVMEEIKKKGKKESKKRKRVRVYDSDEEDEEAMALKILAGEDESNSNHSNAVRESLESNKSEEPVEEKPSKKSRKKSKPSQPMETKTVSEEFTDEEGYTQVRLVKKLVHVEEKVEEKKPETSENGASDKKETNKEKKVKTEKPASKKQKTEDEEEEDSKPKSKKLSKAAQAKKGQVSITSFFKPAAKV